MKNKFAALASIDRCREIVGNMPNGFSDGEELDAEIESGSPAAGHHHQLHQKSCTE